MPDDAVLDDHRARRRARQDVLLHFRALSSWQDQHKVFKVIQGFFIPSREGLRLAEELERRAECVEAVRQVAAHLGLPKGEAPGVMQYEAARKELGLTLSVWTIERRWHSWNEIRKALGGQAVRKTARERSRFQAAIRHKPRGEEWLASVREWLEGRPPSLLALDYDAWAVERNQARPDLPPASTTSAIRDALGLSWRETLKVVQGDLSLAEAQARHKKKLRRECGGFVSLHGVALIRGFTRPQARHRMKTDRAFPPYAFKLHGERVWRWEDVEAHHKGEPFPKRKRGEMQGEVFGTEDIMRLYGLTRKELHEAIRRRRPDVPRPAGYVSRNPYWMCAEVEAWLDERRAA
jgi:predicted DNA-binding transcriptional regulator AlpA